MSSSREISPARESSPTSPLQLTPTSKVKALLAAFDDDSDEESVLGIASSKIKQALVNNGASKVEEPDLTVDNASVLARESQKEVEDDDEEEDEIVRSKGRMAARMLAGENASDTERGQSDADNARARVKMMLMAKKTTPEPSAHEDVEESESDGPVVSRKRKLQTPRRGGPISSPKDSPGLFGTPTTRKSPSHHTDGSDSEDLPINPVKDDRFKALVEKKREERRAKEAAEATDKAKKMAERKRVTDMFDEDEDISDDNVEKRLTQQERPVRKASKRAVEEIHRETQRLSRNMQLTHKAVTRKQFKKADFFAKFNFKVTGIKEEEVAAAQPQSEKLPRPMSSSSASHSDVEMHDTPPTSPASHGDNKEKFAEPSVLLHSTEQEEECKESNMPYLEGALISPPLRESGKGKGKAIEQPNPEPEVSKKKYTFKQRSVRIRRSKIMDKKAFPLDNSDSDLEILNSKTPDPRKRKLNDMFDRVPAKQAKEPNSHHALKMLAHLTSPGKQKLGRNQKISVTNYEMQTSLQQKARQQALREREDKLQALRDKGVVIQTAEEREKELAEVEDLIARARREGEEIMQREKAAAKKERKVQGEVDPLGDSSDDDDWEEEKDDLAEELSGSGSDEERDGPAGDVSGEEEEEEEEEDADEVAVDVPETAEIRAAKSMFDVEADETDEDEVVASLSMNDEMAKEEQVADDMDELPVNQVTRRPRKNNVISDDEDEDIPVMETPVAPRTTSPKSLHTDSPIAPNSVLRSATKTFIPGVTIAGPAGLGLTQIFAGTMDESQLEESSTAADPTSPQLRQSDSISFFNRFPAPELPPFIPTMPSMEGDSQHAAIDIPWAQSQIPESQTMESQTQAIQLGFSQSQIHGFDSFIDPMGTQISEYPEATQDVGFQHMTPIRGRFADAPPSTIDTVVLGPTAGPELVEEIPVAKKKGKLRRRAQIAAFSDEEDAEEEVVKAVQDEFDMPDNLFDVMRKASKKKIVVDEFDKKKSEAKGLVNEQAEESEDEYAGLGGASDDESGGEEDEFVKQMIDDEGGKVVDERQLAAFFADRERASDEKQVEKLYNDITKGMLRRRRGADYDLSDSDDGGEARRRMKRKEFAKMRKALLSDERIGKIAENPKRQAFLRAIEDRGSEDEMDFLDDFAEQEEAADSQSQSQAEDSQQRVPDSQPESAMGPPKRKRSDNATEAEMRPPPNLRRTKPVKKPSNISEIRESLSKLIEEPNKMLSAAYSESDTEDELEFEGESDSGTRREKGKEIRDPFALRRTNVQTVDRIALKRASSSDLSANTRLAFATSSAAPGFKVPPLLRRATTNSSIVSGSSSTHSSVSGGMSATERMAGGTGNEGVKRGGGKNSGVNFFARESERRAAVIKTEKRREQKRFKGAEVRRKVVGGLFGGGKFE